MVTAMRATFICHGQSTGNAGISSHDLGNDAIGPCPIGKRHVLGSRPPANTSPCRFDDQGTEQILADLDRVTTVDVARVIDGNQLQATMNEGVGRGERWGGHASKSRGMRLEL